MADRLHDYKSKYDMAIIEETRKQVDQEIKMLKHTPKISDKSKFLSKKTSIKSKHLSFTKLMNFQIDAKSKTNKTINGKYSNERDEKVVQRLMHDAERRNDYVNLTQTFAPLNKRPQGVKDIEIFYEETKHNQTGDVQNL